MSKPFTMMSHDLADKYFDINGPGIRMSVDYDDVDHDAVDECARVLVRCLNDNWSRYGRKVPTKES